jgi:ATP-dependent protease HslVU (ClpYQ) peptidase subunit
VTAIVACRIAGQVALGGDRWAGDAGGATVLASPKVWLQGPLLIGYCGDFSDAWVFRKAMRSFVAKHRRMSRRHITESLPEALRDAFRWNESEDSGYLICHGESIYEVAGSSGVFEVAPDVVGIGAGGTAVAAAALALISAGHDSPVAVASSALAATAAVHPYVCGPFDVVQHT